MTLFTLKCKRHHLTHSHFNAFSTLRLCVRSSDDDSFHQKTHRSFSRERKVFGIQTIANDNCMAWLLSLILRVNNLCVSKQKQINRNFRHKWSMVTHWIIIFAWRIVMFNAWKCLLDNIYSKLWSETRSFRLLYQSTWKGMGHTHETKLHMFFREMNHSDKTKWSVEETPRQKKTDEYLITINHMVSKRMVCYQVSVVDSSFQWYLWCFCCQVHIFQIHFISVFTCPSSKPTILLLFIILFWLLWAFFVFHSALHANNLLWFCVYDYCRAATSNSLRRYIFESTYQMTRKYSLIAIVKSFIVSGVEYRSVFSISTLFLFSTALDARSTQA